MTTNATGRRDDWVVDTCVIEETNKPFEPHYMDAMTLLTSIAKHYWIAVDVGDEIYNEYNPYMPWGSFARQWWIKITGTGKVSFLASTLPKKVKNHLVNDLKFDNDDIKFVGVAHRTVSRKLISKDSDYHPSIVKCLKDDLNITHYDIPTACAECP